MNASITLQCLLFLEYSTQAWSSNNFIHDLPFCLHFTTAGRDIRLCIPEANLLSEMVISHSALHFTGSSVLSPIHWKWQKSRALIFPSPYLPCLEYGCLVVIVE